MVDPDIQLPDDSHDAVTSILPMSMYPDDKLSITDEAYSHTGALAHGGDSDGDCQSTALCVTGSYNIIS